jgi:hypothetical protein
MLNAQMVSVSSLKIGKLEIKDFHTVLLDLTHINNLYRTIGNRIKIWGLIGGDILKKYKARIDYHKKELVLSGLR